MYENGTINAESVTSAVEVRASFVIVRGLTIIGPRRHGVYVARGVHHVVVEGCDISGWGRRADDGFGCNNDFGIFVNGDDDPDSHHFVIQCNRIHHPRWDTNCSEEARTGTPNCSYADDLGSNNYAHPQGPEPIGMKHTMGQIVIRYNELYSDDDHRFNDGMRGSPNFSFTGFPFKDSDIYGNLVTHSWDNGIEAEGANCNVRVYENLLDKHYGALGLSPTSIGPLYVFRNISWRTAKCPWKQGRGQFTKSQSRTSSDGIYYGGGRVYVLNNTVYRDLDAGLGTNVAVDGVGTQLDNYVTRNNVFLVGVAAIGDRDSHGVYPLSDYDSDLSNVAFPSLVTDAGMEEHGIVARPIFRGDWADGDLRLDPSSPGYDQGIEIPTITDGFTGNAPDLGAMEDGLPPARYGVDAYCPLSR